MDRERTESPLLYSLQGGRLGLGSRVTPDGPSRIRPGVEPREQSPFFSYQIYASKGPAWLTPESLSWCDFSPLEEKGCPAFHSLTSSSPRCGGWESTGRDCSPPETETQTQLFKCVCVGDRQTRLNYYFIRFRIITFLSWFIAHQNIHVLVCI